MSDDPRARMLARIRENIESHGYHVYLITSGSTPRWLYTIGLHESAGIELVLAGGLFFDKAQARRILDAGVEALQEGSRAGTSYRVGDLGGFTLGAVHASWAGELLLGALDYYRPAEIAALQILPDETHRTLDVPDLSRERTPESDPVWRWLDRDWGGPVPEGTSVVTDLAALRGARITEAARWEEDHWEVFAGAGPDVPPDEVRVVPASTLLGHDPSLEQVLRLPVGKALRRDETDGDWEPWGD